MTESISRRTLAKGAAWSVPVVGAAAAVTPASASPSTGGPGLPCSAISDKILERNGGTVTTYDVHASGLTYKKGTAYSINTGIWHVPSHLRTKYRVTGFYVNPGFCGTPCELATGQGFRDAVKGVIRDGTRFVGTVNSYVPTQCSPQVAETGLTSNVTVHTNIQYRWGKDCTDPGWQIKGISIPYSITYLQGLKQAYKPVGSCCKYLNITWPQKLCMAGARDATSLTWSDKPLFG